MKRPAFQFYPADWRKDNELGACGYSARGQWWEMLCVMHEAKPYGHMARDGVALSDQAAANLCRFPIAVYRAGVIELEANGVLSRTAEGVIYSRRMVRDEALRNKRAEFGKLGGNPALLNTKDNQSSRETRPKDNPSLNSVPTPAVAFASASSPASSKPAVERIPDIDARENGSHRRDEKAGNVKTESWSTPAWVNATAKTLDMERRNGERDDDFADRVHTEVDARRRKASHEAKRHA